MVGNSNLSFVHKFCAQTGDWDDWQYDWHFVHNFLQVIGTGRIGMGPTGLGRIGMGRIGRERMKPGKEIGRNG